MMRNNRGFSLMEGLLVVALVALIGFAAWTWFQAQNEPEVGEMPAPQETVTVEDADDLEAAEEYLHEEANPDSQLDTTEIESTLEAS